MRLISIPTTARKIGCGAETLRAMARCGTLPTVQVGKRLKVSETELRRWLLNGGAKTIDLRKEAR